MPIEQIPQDQDAMRRFVAIARRAVLNRKDLNLRDKSVAGRLLDHVQTNPGHRRFGIAWPPQARLAELEGACERTIRRSIARLSGSLFKVACGHNIGANHSSTYRPKWDALLNVEPAPEPDIAPESPEPEMSSKPDDSAIETGQNCPPNLTKNLTNKKEPPLTPPQAGGESSDLIFDSIEDLTLEQVAQAEKQRQELRGTGQRGPFQKRDLAKRRKELEAQADADAILSPVEEVSQDLGAYLRHRSFDRHMRLNHSGRFREVMADWAEAEMAKPGDGKTRIDDWILRSGPPPAPPARQRIAKHQTFADAVNAWHSDLWRIDGGAVVLDALRIGANPIPGQASEAEFAQPGTGVQVVLAWWSRQAEMEAAA